MSGAAGRGRGRHRRSFGEGERLSQEKNKKRSYLQSLTGGGGGKDGGRAAHGQRRQLGLAEVLVVGEEVVDDGVDVGAADGAEQLEVGRGLWFLGRGLFFGGVAGCV